MTVRTPGEIIGISVDPTFVDFGEVVPGEASAVTPTVTVTNEGNVPEDFTAEILNPSDPDVYTTGLTIDGALVSGWSAPGVAVNDLVEPPLILTLPRGAPSGTHTATLVFWAIASP